MIGSVNAVVMLEFVFVSFVLVEDLTVPSCASPANNGVLEDDGDTSCMIECGTRLLGDKGERGDAGRLLGGLPVIPILPLPDLPPKTAESGGEATSPASLVPRLARLRSKSETELEWERERPLLPVREWECAEGREEFEPVSVW